MPSYSQIISIVGARPQFVKLAPMVKAIASEDGCRHTVIHTGQHYDKKMSGEFFELLELPEPDRNLAIGSATHGAQTAAMLRSIEACLLEQQPDGIFVYGDTNSTLAASLAATKLGIPVAHIEAGLRSFNRRMPEEINRVTTDHCSDRLYAPTPLAMDNLRNENLAERAFLSGDVMRDAVNHFYGRAQQHSSLLERLKLEPGGYALLTLHRPVNTTRETLNSLLPVLEELACECLPVLFPVHPRTRSVIDPTRMNQASINYHEPLNYLDMLVAVASARFVITDSGGLQKEAAFLQTPCVTVRSETEWNELVDLGVNQLVGTDSGALREAFIDACAGNNPFNNLSLCKGLDVQYGKGDAARRILKDFLPWLRHLGHNE